MDEIVLKAMAKWPNVPSVFGWLSLDRRGNWLIKGEPISNEALNAFIDRNYLHDDEGRWFFQNGPQRVFVALAYTPFVYRVASAEHEALVLDTHTGLHVTRINSVLMDEEGAILLDTEHGVGIIYDLDLDRLSPHLLDEHGVPVHEDAFDELLEDARSAPPLWLQFGGTRLKVGHIHSTEVARQFDFVADPAEHVTKANA
jgi:hypothetical protein